MTIFNHLLWVSVLVVGRLDLRIASKVLIVLFLRCLDILSH